MPPLKRASRISAVPPTRLAILGSTGSIGRSALDVVRHHRDRFEVVCLAAHSNTDQLAAQIAEFHPKYVAIAEEPAGKRLASLRPDVTILTGPQGLEELAGIPVDVALCAVVGAAGLKPVLRAVEAGHRIALANKEPMVMAGRIITENARRRGVSLIPVDSEHSAIFQCLQGRDPQEVRCIHLTASGGPFYGRSRESLRHVTPEQAVRHPRWDMGAKISVDSATLMNKGLEVIEAMWLFDMPLEKVEVLIHPQSIVHSLVEFVDGSLLAHLGVTDMRLPIQFALTWPCRAPSPAGRLDLTRLQALTFEPPDMSQFPCLRYALAAAKTGGTAPSLLNAANESAVEAFCVGRISFLQISDVVAAVMDACPSERDGAVEAVLAADREGRRKAAAVIQAMRR